MISGQSADPLNEVLASAFGPVGHKVVLAVVLVSFVSCVLSLQAAASRLSYSMARDGILPASGLLSRFSESRHVPPYSLLVAALFPAVVVVGSKISEDALVAIISFAAMGMYLGFQMVVLAALRARLKGWRPAGKFSLGAWGLPVNVLALVWGVLGMVNMAWPRTPDAPWYDNWLVALTKRIYTPLLTFGLRFRWLVVLPLKGAPFAEGLQAQAVTVYVGFHLIFGIGLALIFGAALALARRNTGASPKALHG